MRLIAIDREYGCGAELIAQQLASRLSWKLWDAAIVYNAAALAGVPVTVAKNCDERLDSWLYRCTKCFCNGFDFPPNLQGANLFDADSMVRFYKKIVGKLAKTGRHVIVGRGAAYFLRGCPEVFRVFLYASRAEKIRRLVADGRKPEEAIALLDHVSKQRAAFDRHYFSESSSDLYDLMVNTGTAGRSVVETILVSMQMEGRRYRSVQGLPQKEELRLAP